MNPISLIISKAIKEAKWIALEYENTSSEVKKFWCAIYDVDIERKQIIVTEFNHMKIDNDNEVDGLLDDARLYFASIKQAEILEHTSYDRPDVLIDKIETHLNELDWLEYDISNDSTLSYLRQCMKYEAVPYVKESDCIPGIDDSVLREARKNGSYKLDLEQLGHMAKSIESIAKQDKDNCWASTELIINVLAIKDKKRNGLFIAIYKVLLFDPSTKSLKVQEENIFNYEFANNEDLSYKYSLRNYLDVEVTEFVDLFKTDEPKARQLLYEALNKESEDLDDRPYIMDQIRQTNNKVDKEFNSMAEQRKKGILAIPMKAFFGNMTKINTKPNKLIDIVCLTEKINIDQFRVINNAFFNPITYVQGPPGTGKTTSIVSTIGSALFNNQKVLLSSHNNKPIEDIYNHFMKKIISRGQPIPFPILRLGNIDVVKLTIKKIKENVEKYSVDKCSKYKVDEKILEIYKQKNIDKLKEINKMIDNYEEKLKLDEEIDAVQSIFDSITADNPNYIKLQPKLNELQNKQKAIPAVDNDQVNQCFTKPDDSFYSWLFFTSVKSYKKLLEPKYKEFIDIINTVDKDEDDAAKKFNAFLADNEKFLLILKVFPIIMTTNLSAQRLGNPEPNFDLTIIDEAGQCPNGPALFPIVRGKRLLLVGDQSQLQPVITLSPEVNKKLIAKYNVREEYNYASKSILGTMQMVDSISPFIFLRYHYRCKENIINFSNKKYYNSKLIISTKDPASDNQLIFINPGETAYRSNDRNTSYAETQAVIDAIKEKISGTSAQKDIGVITPFRNQANLIRKKLDEAGLNEVEVGTVHTFQGDEKSTIYMSTAITRHSSSKTFDWIRNNRELINVAITRAKNTFVMIADYDEVKNRSKENNDYFDLIEYTKTKGQVIIPSSNTDSFVNSSNFKQYNTIKEKEMRITINQILSLNTKLKVNEQVNVSKVLGKLTGNELFHYGTKATFDFVIFRVEDNDDIPVLAIELNGEEHSNNPITIERDNKKKQICKDNGIRLVSIPNDYSRRYMFVKEIFKELLK